MSDFAEHPDHVALGNDGRGMPAVEREKDEARKYKDASTCSQTFDVCIKAFIPRLCAARALDDRLLKPFRYCHTSWRDSAAAVQQGLIEISKNWKERGLAGSCPYLPTGDELAEHKKQYEDLETVPKLKLWFIHALDTDSEGWVPSDEWERSKAVHREAFEEWMQAVRDPAGEMEMISCHS